MKLDPEEQIIAAALDQAALDDANESGAEARIAFARGVRQGDDNDFARVGNEGDKTQLVDWRTLCRSSPNIRPRGVRDRGTRQSTTPRSLGGANSPSDNTV